MWCKITEKELKRMKDRLERTLEYLTSDYLSDKLWEVGCAGMWGDIVDYVRGDIRFSIIKINWMLQKEVRK